MYKFNYLQLYIASVRRNTHGFSKLTRLSFVYPTAHDKYKHVKKSLLQSRYYTNLNTENYSPFVAYIVFFKVRSYSHDSFLLYFLFV
jgi:hypothetical protein